MQTNKILIICYAKNHVDKILSAMKEFKEGKIVVVGLNKESQSKLREENILHKTPEDYVTEDSHKNIGRETITLVRKWGDIKVEDKTLNEFLTYQDVPFWDLIESSFSARLFENYKILQNIKLIKRTIETEKPNEVVVANSKSLIGKAVLAVANSKNIPVRIIKVGTGADLRYLWDRYLINFIYRYLMRLRELQRKYSTKIRNFFYKPKKGMTPAKKNKILIIPYIQTMTLVITPVIRELEKNEDNELLVIRYDLLRDRMKKDFEREKIRYNTLESYATKEVEIRIDNWVKFIRARWNILKNDENFKKSVTYLDMPIWDLVEDLFLFYFSTRARFIEVIRYTETMRYIFDTEKPDIIVTLDDLSEVGKPVMILGKMKRMPTLCIQHGMFGEGSSIFGPSPADKIAVWGQYTEELLIKRDFHPDQIVVTGCPKFDVLFQKDRRVDKEIICRKLGIDPDREIILFTSQPMIGNEEHAQAVFKAMEEFPDKELVIKLHPRETSDKLYRDIAKKMGVNNVLITKNTDLYELLNICDVKITAWSTTALEAMMLGVPVITINLTGNPDPMPYAESGAAIGVYKPEDLALAIKKALYDPQVKKVLEVNREKFVYEHVYKMDGLVSKRVIDLIEKMIEEK